MWPKHPAGLGVFRPPQSQPEGYLNYFMVLEVVRPPLKRLFLFLIFFAFILFFKICKVIFVFLLALGGD
jgi:hypothetical protein